MASAQTCRARCGQLQPTGRGVSPDKRAALCSAPVQALRDEGSAAVAGLRAQLASARDVAAAERESSASELEAVGAHARILPLHKSLSLHSLAA